MSAGAGDLYDLLRKIRYDCTAIQAKLTDAFAMLDTLHLPDAPRRLQCPSCAVSAGGPRELAEHAYHAHDGPLPEHWARVDALVEPMPDA